MAAALVLRCAWVLVNWAQSGAALAYPDEDLHWQLARNLVSQGALVSDSGLYAARMPGYPLFLALFAWAGDTGVLLARLAQCVLGAATVGFVYSLTRRVCGTRAAIVAAGLVCIDPFLIFFSNLLLTEVFFVALAAWLLYAAVALVADDRQGRGAVWSVGLLGVAAVMVRPSAAGWIVLLWALLWWLRKSDRRAWTYPLIWGATVVVVFLPWGLRNNAVIGSPAWLSTNGGITLYDAQGPQADGSSDQSFLADMPQVAALGEVQRDAALRDMAWQQMRSDPGRVVTLGWEKFLRLWSLTPNVEEHSSGAKALVSAGYTLLVLLLAAVGLWQSVTTRPHARESTVQSQHRADTQCAGDRQSAKGPAEAGNPHAPLPAAASRARARGRRLQLLIWLPVVYFTLLHCVFIGSLRYRVPLMPILAISAGIAFMPIKSRETQP